MPTKSQVFAGNVSYDYGTLTVDNKLIVIQHMLEVAGENLTRLPGVKTLRDYYPGGTRTYMKPFDEKTRVIRLSLCFSLPAGLLKMLDEPGRHLKHSALLLDVGSGSWLMAHHFSNADPVIGSPGSRQLVYRPLSAKELKQLVAHQTDLLVGMLRDLHSAVLEATRRNLERSLEYAAMSRELQVIETSIGCGVHRSELKLELRN